VTAPRRRCHFAYKEWRTNEWAQRGRDGSGCGVVEVVIAGVGAQIATKPPARRAAQLQLTADENQAAIRAAQAGDEATFQMHAEKARRSLESLGDTDEPGKHDR
jgi:hypothetical protein